MILIIAFCAGCCVGTVIGISVRLTDSTEGGGRDADQ